MLDRKIVRKYMKIIPENACEKPLRETSICLQDGSLYLEVFIGPHLRRIFLCRKADLTHKSDSNFWNESRVFLPTLKYKVKY